MHKIVEKWGGNVDKVCGKKSEKLGSGNLYLQILKIALPAILSMLVVSFYSICDTYFLGRLGILSCGGVCYPAVAAIQGVAMTFAFGSANNISRAIGASDIESAKEYFFSGFASSVLCGVLIGGLVGIFSPAIVAVCGGGSEASDISGYLAVQGFSFVIFAVYFYFSAVLRSAGRAGVVFFASVVGLACNFGLNYISVEFLDFGVSGVAFATCFSQVLAGAILFFAVLKSEIASFDFLYFSFSAVFRIATLGGSSFFRQLMGGLSALALNFVCVKIGGELLAGATVASRVSVLLFSVALGLGQGMQPVMAYYFGGGNKEKARSAFVFTAICGAILGIVIGGVQCAFAVEIASLIGGENAGAVAVAVKIIRVSAFSVAFSFVLVIINMAFQAVGKKFINILLSVLRQGVIFIPAIFLLGNLFGENGVVISHAVSDILACAVAIFLASIKLFKWSIIKKNKTGELS
ncbi:MAG: MATE family efflux transporter [Bacillota bacterium]